MANDPKNNGIVAQNNFLKERTRIEKQRILDVESVFYSGLVEEYKKNKPVLPERIFVSDFLPYFCGERNINDNVEVLPLWFSIAGNPSGEVTIIDTAGRSLFDVPPVINSSKFDPTYNKDRSRMSIDDIEHMSNQLSKTIPIRGDRYRDEAYNERLRELANKAYDPSNLEKRWLDIFIRYGKIKLNVSNVTSVQTSTSASNISDDDLEY